MIRRGILKSKFMVDLHNLMMKRGKFAGKAIGNLMFHHNYSSTFGCRSQDQHLSFITPTPREYEFSCSNTPNYNPFHVSTNKHRKNRDRYNRDITTVNAVQKILEMLNNEVTVTEAASPLLPGFGLSTPRVRQLRITDSPFPLKNGEEDSHVDKEAEEFIERFYQQLRLQKWSRSPI
ncbi:hypothetical protein GIB67_043162 [Kingdonia uniflora]|uniref:Avr9/Cf-9 rapidly elicited protein 146 n=1 Tax=Kingdonia uniflora TaxID=39325 RepID=A0A7J7NJ74_9MAGN|nr:hypothetical protein GIB67_043162 [Kingdonia uniflora]